jgi:hypothetical protein
MRLTSPGEIRDGVFSQSFSGDFTWPEGWIFSIWFIVLCFSTILSLYRKDPALLEERYK